MMQTNDDNVASLVQSCFNSLSLWLNFCILDAYGYFPRVASFFQAIRNLLIRLKSKIDLNL